MQPRAYGPATMGGCAVVTGAIDACATCRHACEQSGTKRCPPGLNQAGGELSLVATGWARLGWGGRLRMLVCAAAAGGHCLHCPWMAPRTVLGGTRRQFPRWRPRPSAESRRLPRCCSLPSTPSRVSLRRTRSRTGWACRSCARACCCGWGSAARRQRCTARCWGSTPTTRACTRGCGRRWGCRRRKVGELWDAGESGACGLRM